MSVNISIRFILYDVFSRRMRSGEKEQIVQDALNETHRVISGQPGKANGGVMECDYRIVQSEMRYVRSYNGAVDRVAREKKYLAATEGFALEQTESFLKMIVENRYPQFFALRGSEVIGWCDVIPKTAEGMRHVGVLGMGVVEKYRSGGIGTGLLDRTLKEAARYGLEKVELEVFASNRAAVRLYARFGFETEGKRVRARKLHGRYDDILLMGLFLRK
ncbi:MAG: N-acetyltransferase family protein [Chitinispirillaceae bacterium]